MTDANRKPVSNPEVVGSSAAVRLPWGAVRERVAFPESVHINVNNKPGAFVLQMIFAEFTVLAEKKIELVLDSQNKDKPLSKLLQRGEDAVFDQLLSVLNSASEHSLPSVLRCMFDWYDRQNPMDEAGNCLYRRGNKVKGEKEVLCEKRDLAVDFIYCLVLIEVLKQLPYHPGHDDLVTHIISLAFRHFKYREISSANPNAANINIVADLYAEVIGVLAQSRFAAVKKRFMFELRELRTREQTQVTNPCVISLLMGMKFFRVKMHPLEEFQASIQFLHECGQYFLELKDRDKEIKHALSGLFVEILLPVAAVVKNEVNVPVLKTFVEQLYVPTLDAAMKRKHSLALFPMVTCLLCVSQKQFFLNNWPTFLTQCLAKLRDRDSTTARVALESLFRLLWVYMIRIKCESNTTTASRLQSIVVSLFPRGSRFVVPKDAPLSIFVKIIQFIAQERLDFAMKEIIFDLLCVGKSYKTVFFPERMSIGLRAFLVIADSRQQHDGDPPMPQTMGVLPSGSTLRFKKTFINKYLSEQTASNIGLASYYGHVRKAFGAMLRYLDSQVGRAMSLTRAENVNKEPDDIITGERKPKIDLFRVCVGAMPRLLPDEMSPQDLIDLLARLTLHMDDELGKLAFQSLQNIAADLSDWRTDVVSGFVHFIHREVLDTFPQLIEQCHRRLIVLLTQWKTVALTNNKTDIVSEKVVRPAASEADRNCATLHAVEGLALVMLCSSKPVIRKQAVIMLKESRNLFTVLDVPKEGDHCVLDMLDRACPVIIEQVLPHLPGSEKAAALSAYPVDFQWLTDRTSIIWTSGTAYHKPPTSDSAASDGGVGVSGTTADTGTVTLSSSAFDSWIHSIAIFMRQQYVVGHCVTAVQHAWPYLFTRLNAIQMDHQQLTNDSRASSLLRGAASRKLATDRDMHMTLWKNYVVMGCCIAPPSHTATAVTSEYRCVTPELTAMTSSPDMADRSDQLTVARPVSPGMTARELFKNVVQNIKCDLSEMRETAIVAFGHANELAFRDLMEEIVPLMKEAIDRKAENPRRKKRRDVLRLSLLRIFLYMANNGIFARCSSDVISPMTDSLSTVFVEFIDGVRLVIEMEADKDSPLLNDIRVYFSRFIHHLVSNTPVSRRHKLLSQDLRAGLCQLFAVWSGRYGLGTSDRGSNKHIKRGGQELELAALQACAATLCCGVVYDPSGLNEKGYIYAWLYRLMTTRDELICKLVQETMVLLLEFNQDAQTLLDWVIDCCYTAPRDIADSCFLALATVFNNREYPCDQVAMLNVTLLYVGSATSSVRDIAVHLLHLLYKRFFMDDFVLANRPPTTSDDAEDWKMMRDELFVGPGSRSQVHLSLTLAKLHPDLTMPMFSEIMHRLAQASFAVRESLLDYVLPWLYNMELVEPSLLSTTTNMDSLTSKDLTSDTQSVLLKGRGWGSPEATDMILNNLLYITLTLSADHEREIEELWAALVACWPGNLSVIMRYLVIIVGMYPHVLLPWAKRIVSYVAHAKPERLVDEVIGELRTTEPLQANVERMETPPFYRLTRRLQPVTVASCDTETRDDDARNASAAAAGQTSSLLATTTTTTAATTTATTTQLLDKGHIHTKRHSADDPAKLSSASELPSKTSCSPSASAVATASAAGGKLLLEEPMVMPEVSDVSLNCHQPHPLPMPAYGGYYAPLSQFLPTSGSLPTPPYQRCNLALMLMSDLVLETSLCIDWTIHLPFILHLAILGLDNTRPLIHEHCKKLLINVLLVFATHADHFTVAKLAISSRTLNEPSCLNLAPSSTSRAQTEETADQSTVGPWPTVSPSLVSPATVRSAAALPPVDNLTIDNMDDLPDVADYSDVSLLSKTLIEFLLTRKCRPLWAFEEITSKVHHIKSAESLELLLNYFVRIFTESLPLCHIVQRWAREAMHLALSCSSRHYAGRSFQVFRALRVSLTCNDLCDVLSRLVETVAEQGEDMQGYVAEIMLTLAAAVDNLDVNVCPLIKDAFMSTPNLAKDPAPTSSSPVTSSSAVVVSSARMFAGCHGNAVLSSATSSPYTHIRSTSYNLAALSRKAIVSSPPILENKEFRGTRHPSGDGLTRLSSSNLLRSRSSQSLRQTHDVTSLPTDDRLTVLVQMFWISVSLLESDFEYEFLLAVRLLDKILDHLQPDRPECLEKLDHTLKVISWNEFPGVQSLLLKGLTSAAATEPTWCLLSKLTSFVSCPIIDPTDAGFAINVVALLPYLAEHYDEPSSSCIDAAVSIADACQSQSPQLDNLATVMTQYSRQTFTKGAFQWTKCVVHHLYSVYSSVSDQIIAFLVEILDKGPLNMQAAVLQILHCVFYCIDIPSSSLLVINADLLRVVTRYIENTSLWKDALKIIKLCVMRSSSFSAPPPNITRNSTADCAASAAVELPGRTMEFTFDQTQISIIGSKYWDIVTSPKLGVTESAITAPASNSGSVSRTTTTTSSDNVSSWKRPASSQLRTRERLVSLLNCYGHHVIPKSPSVIFDPQSPGGTIDRASSITPGTSSDEASTLDGAIAGDGLPMDDDGSAERQIQSVFDFLDEPDDLNRGLEYWGANPRHSLTEHDDDDDTQEHKAIVDSSDEDTQSISPVEDFHAELTSGVPPSVLVHTSSTLHTSRTSISGSNVSIASTDADTAAADITELSPSHLAVSSSSVAVVKPCMSTSAINVSLLFTADSHDDSVDRAWREHVNEVLSTSSGAESRAVRTFHLFPRLFYDTRSLLSSLTMEVCQCLTRYDSLKDINSQLSVLKELTTDMECPLLYCDFDAMELCGMVERHRFLLLELHECYSTYMMRRDQTTEALDQLRHQQSAESSPQHDVNTTSLKLRQHVVGCVYRVYFQLVQMFESYCKLVSSLASQASNFTQIVDLSAEMVELRGELQRIQSGDGGYDTAPLRTEVLCQSDVERMIVDCVSARRYSKALQCVRYYGRIFHGEAALIHASGDVETILYLYCRHVTDGKPGYYAVISSSSQSDLSHLHRRLLDIKSLVSTMSTSPTGLTGSPRHHGTSTPSDDRLLVAIKQSDSSTL